MERSVRQPQPRLETGTRRHILDETERILVRRPAAIHPFGGTPHQGPAAVADPQRGHAQGAPGGARCTEQPVQCRRFDLTVCTGLPQQPSEVAGTDHGPPLAVALDQGVDIAAAGAGAGMQIFQHLDAEHDETGGFGSLSHGFLLPRRAISKRPTISSARVA